MSIVKTILEFLKTYRISRSLPLTFIWRTRALFYVLVIVYTLCSLSVFPFLQNLQPVKIQEFIDQESIRVVIGIAAVLGPLMEELLFRAGMKWGGKNVSWLVGAILFLLIKYFFGDFIDQFLPSQFYKSLVGYGLYLLCVLLGFQIIKPWLPKVSRIYARRPGRVFRILTVSFGLAHVMNFDSGGSWVLLLVVPQLLLGIMLGYVRMQWGLRYSILLHMFHNLIQIIPILILKYMGGMVFDSTVMNIDSTIGSGLIKPEFIATAIFFVIIFSFLSYQIIQECIAFFGTKNKLDSSLTNS